MRHTTDHQPEVQIIGGGIGGLLAAALAAERGISVRLHERRTDLGGRAGTLDHDGFRLNHGPHAVYQGGPLDRQLRRLGVRPTGAKPSTRGALGTIGDRIDLLPQGPVSMARTSLLSAGEKARLVGLFARLPRIATDRLGSVSVAEWLDDVAPSEGLRTVLGGLISLTTYNRADSLTSADAAVTNLAMGAGPGVRYLDGGWQQIVDALDKHGAGTGLVDHVHATVQSVERRGAGWTVVTDQGETTSPTIIVAVGSPRAADRLLGTDLADRAGPPVQASVLDLGLATAPPTPTVIGLDTRLYASLHSVAAGLAPQGRSLMTLARYLPPAADDDQAEDHRANRAVLVDHARRAGIDLDDVVMERYLHRLTVAWGMPLASQGGLAGRPTATVPELDGAFVAGDWVGPVGLLADASAASAAAAVDGVAAALAGSTS